MCLSAKDILEIRPILDKISSNIPITEKEFNRCLECGFPINQLKPILTRSSPLS